MKTFPQKGISPTPQSPSSPSFSTLPHSPHDVAKDVAERIARVHVAMQDLLALYEAPSLHAKNASRPDAPSRRPAHQGDGEMRCYYFSPSALKQERTLLCKYGLNDFRDLLAEAHLLLAGLVKIMKSTHPDARLRGSAVSSLGTLLEHVSGLMIRMRNVYGTVEQIQS